MRRFGMAAALVMVTSGVLMAQQPGAAPLTDLRQKVSYIIGSNIGRQLKQDGIDLDLAVLVKGLQEGLAGAKPLLTDEEIQQAMTQFQQQMAAKQQQKALAAGDKNKQDGVAFLAQNKAAEGVKALPSGLQYKVLKSGAGPSPKLADTVTTHYRGTLLDGTVFDSSYDRGQPATFPVGGVIKGWTEALQLMKVGDKWQLFVPAELAYGERGAGQDIGPNATLVFEVELLGIEAGKGK